MPRLARHTSPFAALLPALLLIVLVAPALFALAALAGAAGQPPAGAPATRGLRRGPVVPAVFGDDFDAAVAITGARTTSNDTRGATQAPDDPVPLCPLSGSLSTNWGASVWYRYVASAPGALHVDSEGSTYDTVIAVWTGARGSLEPVTCNNDSSASVSWSAVDFPVEPNVTYYIEVSDFQNPSPGGELVLTSRTGGGMVAWRRAVPMLTDRDWLAAAGTASQIYVLGGRVCPGCVGSSGTYTVTAENARYTVATSRWSPAMALPVPLYGHKAVQLAGKIYVPGGLRTLGLPNPVVGDPSHYVYDVATNSWTAAASPWPGGNAAGFYSVAADEANNRYYLLGGLGATPQHLASLYRYDVISDTWTQLPSLPVSPGRYGHVSDLIGGKLYVAGGYSPTACLAETWVYDPVAASWTQLDDFVGQGRCFMTSLVVPGTGAVPYRWLIVGGSLLPGLDGVAGDILGTAQLFDPNNGRWTQLAGNYNTSWPRRAAAVASTPGGIFVLGGTSDYDNDDGDRLTSLNERYVPQSTSLVVLQLFNQFAFSDATEPNQDYASAYPIAQGTSLQGYFPFAADSDDYYRFSVPLTATVTLRLSEIPAGVDPGMFLYKSNRFFVAYSNNSGSLDEEIIYTAAPGTYYVRVYQDGSVALPAPAYRLTLNWP
jgi:N-acetylneuraminic acid mutarotase